MFVNVGVSTVGQPGVSGVMLALQMAGFEVTAFDADRVYVNVEVRSWMGYDLEQAMQSAVELTKDALTLFPELKSLKVTAYGEAPVDLAGSPVSVVDRMAGLSVPREQSLGETPS